jgi:L-ascorbate metabolism protein UlaG (beta-lactamase superfamily)
MVITFYGEGCFKVQSGDFVILTDPFENSIGLTPPRLKADITLKTLTPLSLIKNQEITTQKQQIIIIGPGEYHIKDVGIAGFLLPKESSEKFFKTVYSLSLEGINLCFLGHLSEIPEPSTLERLGKIDVLFIPAGGPPFIDQKLSVKFVKQLQPKIVVPSFFKIPSLKRSSDKIELFLEEFNGQKNKQAEMREKLVIKKKDVADIKKTEIAVLKP